MTDRFINSPNNLRLALNDQKSAIKRNKIVEHYNSTSPSVFDENCIKSVFQITLWNNGRKASRNQPLQKDWFNHYTRAILTAQERLGLSQWDKMQELPIEKNYKAKCKKITIPSMKVTHKKVEPQVDEITQLQQQIEQLQAQLNKVISKRVNTPKKKWKF